MADRGPGIDAGERSKIFEAFHRVPDGADAAGHAGLGLAIAHELARAQGGDLRYDEREGGGSLFTLRFPRAYSNVSDDDTTAD